MGAALERRRPGRRAASATGRRTSTIPHFLGAVVLQQVQKQTGLMQERTIIDGQQRLTTLAAAARRACTRSCWRSTHCTPAMRTRAAGRRMRSRSARSRTDRFKVWPTNRDRPAFNAVMARQAACRLRRRRPPRRADGRGAPLLQRAGARVAVAERARSSSPRGRPRSRPSCASFFRWSSSISPSTRTRRRSSRR